MLKALTPNLIVEDVSATIDWYRTALGFETVTTVPGEGKLAFAIMRRDDVQVMFQSTESLREDLGGGTNGSLETHATYYTSVTGVQDLRRETDGKVRVVKDLHETFYGTREFIVADPNGYVLFFAEDLSPSE